MKCITTNQKPLTVSRRDVCLLISPFSAEEGYIYRSYLSGSDHGVVHRGLSLIDTAGVLTVIWSGLKGQLTFLKGMLCFVLSSGSALLISGHWQ